jgi:hypothetical protein
MEEPHPALPEGEGNLSELPPHRGGQGGVFFKNAD